MTLHRHLIAAALLAGLSACASQYTESEWPKDITLNDARGHVDLRFAPGSARLAAADVGRLRAMAARGDIAPSDRVVVATGGPPRLAQARVASVAEVLLPYRIVTTQGPLAPLPPNRGVMTVGRYLVNLPDCPNWSKYPPVLFTNTHASNFGCSTAVDLAAMVASPADLAEGRRAGLPDAIPAAAAVQRFQSDKVQLPSSSSIGPIGASSTGPTGSGATGAGTAGTGP